MVEQYLIAYLKINNMSLKKPGRRKTIKAFEQSYRDAGKIKTGEYNREKREFYYDRKNKKVSLLPSDDADRPITDGVKKRNLGENFKSPIKKSEPRKTTKGKGRNFRTTEEGAGMTAKGVKEYRKKNPGSKLKTAVTGKVKPGSKDAKRRKSFCARSRGWTGPRGKAARRRWKC